VSASWAGPRWDDVGEGDAIAPLTVDVTYTTLAMDVAGTRDFYPLHHDPVVARASGAPDIFLNTMWYQGIVGRYVTDWGGSEAFLRRLRVDMRAHCCPGDQLTVHGTVVRRHRDAEQRLLVDLDVRIDRHDHPDAVVAAVTVELAPPPDPAAPHPSLLRRGQSDQKAFHVA
jgi:hypothetical protein